MLSNATGLDGTESPRPIPILQGLDGIVATSGMIIDQC